VTLTAYLATRPAPDQQAVTARLTTLSTASGLGYQAVQNLWAESRLDALAWKDAVDALVAAPNDPAAIRSALTGSLRGRTLEGPSLPLPWPTLLGRAMTLKRFCQLLVTLGYYASVSTARRAVRNLVGRDAAVTANRWRNHELARHDRVMWGTFDADDPSSDPFGQLPPDADGIRGRLGLDRNERGDPLLLLQHELPTGTEPRFPTVAEAYAADEWNYFFRLAPAGATSGLTMPWPECHDDPPCPEVVHEVIRGAQIRAPLQERP